MPEMNQSPLSTTPAFSQPRTRRITGCGAWSLTSSVSCDMRSKHFSMSASRTNLGFRQMALKDAQAALFVRVIGFGNVHPSYRCNCPACQAAQCPG